MRPSYDFNRHAPPVTGARAYSADGTLNSQTWGNGKVETRSYDLQGRLTQLKVGTDTRSYFYDANGNVTQKVSAPETGNYTYDMLDRLATDNNGTNTTFGYDANGNRTLLGPTANVYTTNSNRLTQVGTTTLTLDAAGNTLTNGPWTYSYSNAGQLSQAKNGATLAGSYVYNALRQRTRKTVGTVTTVFHYDSSGHLIAETQSTGQLLRAYVYADDAPVAQIEPITVLPPEIIVDNTQAAFTGTWATATSIAGYYGSNYRSNTKGTGADKAVWTVNVPSTGTYQVYARWVAASTHASNAPFTVKYNGGSATVKKSQRTSNGAWVLLGSYTFSAGTAGSVTLTDKADGTVIADAIKLVATTGGSTQEVLRSLHTDHLNTPRLATNAQGTIIWRWEGKAFGDTAPNEDPDLDTIKTTINLRFPGQYAEAESGLFYNWNRYYDPKVGRYLTSDPIGLEGGLNTYQYANADPLRFVDPTGLEIVGEFESFNVPMPSWEFLGLTSDLKRAPNGNVLVDRLGYFNFQVSGSLDVTVKCKEIECGKIKREWSLSGEIAVDNIKLRLPYDEPAIPIPGMGWVILADKIWRTGEFINQAKGLIAAAGKALLNSPTKICKGSAFRK